jgi:hypothetical protein
MGKFTRLTSTLFLAVLVVFSFGSCKKTIKVKKLIGSWKVSSATFSETSSTSVAATDAGSDCNDPGTETVTNSSDYTLTYNGAKVNTEQNANNNGLTFGSTSDYDLTMDVTINDDGTYKVSGTYKFTDIDGDSRTTNYSTDLNEWYVDENNESNDAVVFHNFPNVLGFSGSLDYSDVVLNIEEGNGDEIVFTSASKEDNTVTDVESRSGNCVRTTATHTVNTNNRTVTFTSAD